VAGTADALHPQTLLAYGMNGEALQADHGARFACASDAISATSTPNTFHESS
jgi:hypothetical protein